jgi:hypothetical protein
VHFTNPYRTVIAGTVRVRAPQGWLLNPPSYTFSLNPGETFDRELTIQFPYNSYAGTKNLAAEFTMQGEEEVFTVPIALKLGLSDVGMQTLAIVDGKDLVVQQMITNYGDRVINYDAFSVFPGYARQERLVSDLSPGKTTLKRYRFKDVKIAPGTKVRVGLKERDGSRVLNEELDVL